MNNITKEFWDNRYEFNSQLGSGLGSRGENVDYKRKLIELAADCLKPDSILDIGCGDQAVSGGLPDDIYTGIDISSVVIKRNRERYPRRSFFEGDFLEMPLSLFDMTICFDVVIHIEDLNNYRRFIERMVEMTGKGGIISGYEEPVNKADSSFIHYHEPLSKTLSHVGAGNIQTLGKYRGTDVWFFSKDEQHRYLGDYQPFNPVFLVGTMRSGTTLIADLLGLHPGIVYCPFELKGTWSRAGGISMASPKTQDTTCRALTAADVRETQRAALRNAFQKVFKKNQGRKKDNALFLNKNPHLCNKLPFVDGLFPGAKFIWIYRDLTRVTTSLKKLLGRNRWHYWPVKKDGKPRCWEYYSGNNMPLKLDRARLFPGGDIKYLAEYWYESNKAARDFSRMLSGARFLAVREEDLINNPRDILAGCQAFLRVPLKIPETIYKIDSSRNNRWVNQLDKKEIRSLLQFVLQHEQGIDYIIGQPGISLLWKRELTDLLKGSR